MEMFFGIITIISFLYAIYVNRKHAKLLDYNREQAWEIYRQASNALSHYQELEKSNINEQNLIVHIAKGEKSAQELIASTTLMIKRFEKAFTFETIDKWAKEGKLPNETHVKSMKSFV